MPWPEISVSNKWSSNWHVSLRAAPCQSILAHVHQQTFCWHILQVCRVCFTAYTPGDRTWLDATRWMARWTAVLSGSRLLAPYPFSLIGVLAMCTFEVVIHMPHRCNPRRFSHIRLHRVWRKLSRGLSSLVVLVSSQICPYTTTGENQPPHSSLIHTLKQWSVVQAATARFRHWVSFLTKIS